MDTVLDSPATPPPKVTAAELRIKKRCGFALVGVRVPAAIHDLISEEVAERRAAGEEIDVSERLSQLIWSHPAIAKAMRLWFGERYGQADCLKVAAGEMNVELEIAKAEAVNYLQEILHDVAEVISLEIATQEAPL